MKTRFKALTSIATLGSAGIGAAVYLGLMSTVTLTPGCTDDSGGGKCKLEAADATLDEAVECAAFTNPGTIDNEFFPLTPGTTLVLEGTEDGELINVTIDVTSDTEPVGTVNTVVVTETETIDGELAEISRNYYAQSDTGAVCYFGEAVDNYEDGVVANNDGSWRADDAGNAPGIIMPATPAVGDIYNNEAAPGVAEDMSEIIALGEAISTTGGDFTDTVSAEDCNPLDREEPELKVYAIDTGIVFDNGIELQSIN